MGQKVNPNGFRIGVIRDWESTWYADKHDFAGKLKEDYDIRTYLKKKYYNNAISKIIITRAQDAVNVTIYTAKPGVMICQKGANIEKIKGEVKKLTKAQKININIREIKKDQINLSAQLQAENIAAQLENRVQFRRAIKHVMKNTMDAGAKGIKAMAGGRLEGADIARSECYHDGSIPLQTLRADIDYGFAIAHTTFGVIGVKVWIYTGEVLKAKNDATKEGGNA
jgi:small subunit ribosomal protein S3